MRLIPLEENPPVLRLKSVLEKKAGLQKFFKKQPVDLVIIHGSLAKDRMKPLSDVDVAVLFSKKYDYSHISEISLKLAELLERDDIDIAVLNRASPLFWMQVLVKGLPIYQRNKKVFGKFRLQAIQRYLATKYLRTTFHRYQREAILGR